jgi:Ca-activated chloride channel family protein
MILGLLLLFMVSVVPVAAHPAFNVRRGLAALEGGNLEQAESELQRARFAEPGNPVVAYNLGVVSYRRRDYQKAAGFFMQSAAIAGSDAQMKFDSLYNLGNTAFKAGDYAAAVSAYNGSLEVKEDAQARYNLEVASKKLQEQQQNQHQKEQQQEKQQNQQQNKDQQNQQQNKDQQSQQQNKDQQSQQQDGQKQDQAGEQDKSDQKSGEQQDQKDQNDQNGQQGDQQQKQQSGSEDKQGESENQQQADSDEQKSGEQSDQQQAQKPESGSEDRNASQTSPLNEQAAEDPSKNREDVQMGSAEDQKQEPQKPEASQRARALKNVKLNPYQVERLLQQMQERERQAQLHYRNEPQRMDEEDPFNMDARQLQEWMQNRGRRRQQQPADEPDW